MKKIFKCALGLTAMLPLAAIPMVSCGETQIESNVIVNKDKYFAQDIVLPTIYLNSGFSFTITMNDGCYINTSNSYLRCGYNHSHAFDGSRITATKEGNVYTITVNSSIITSSDFVNVYVEGYKQFDIDTSSSSSDITFKESLTPYPVEDETYTIGFTINNSKALDMNTSTITVGGGSISFDEVLVYEATLYNTLYTFITIPSSYITGNVSLKLQTTEAVATSIVTYPEYTTTHLTNVGKNNDFYCYFTITNSDYYQLDTDNAVIKVGETELTTSDYSFTTLLSTTCLKINGDKVTDTISIDVPPIEIYTCYPCHVLYETPTVSVEGEKIVKGKQYKFVVTPLDNKDVLWDNTNTYIEVNDEKLTKDNGFSVSDKSESGTYTVTVDAAKCVGDMFCHFITA